MVTQEVLPLYINGQFVLSELTFPNINPVTGQTKSLVSEAEKAHVDAAVAAARRAVDGEWGNYSAFERAQILRKIADGIEAHFDEFVAAEVADTGRPLYLARTLDVPRAIANFRLFADLAASFVGESCETKLQNGYLLNYSVRKPLGVIAVISPWNLPVLLFSWKVAPALAAGNAVVCKPSEETPSSATLLAEVIDSVGLPKGAFNLVHGFGAKTGAFLTENPDIDAVSFTGGSKTGSHIMKTVADGVKEVSFELGGKNAAVVFADADFDAAVEGVLKSSFYNSGQVCMCSERVYVHRSLFDRFVAALKIKTEALRLDVPNAEGVDLGPMVSFAHRDKVLSYFKLAEEEGATVVTGGKIPLFGDERDQGAFVEPTIWTGLPDDARVVNEEIFGPCCHIAPFDDEDEVLARVNNSEYGLNCSIWTQNISRAHRFARKIHVGIVWVNTWYSRDLRTPFGGSKRSGLGREGGVFSLNAYSEITNVCVKF
ncbi:MAG: 2-hydroxymuconic semialdehyde dehydrogenase [Neisseria sp.]|uniref:2-hydroxymuconic semialdehyde dehydrogenase n=1 Tax=Neisseria sp. TaxID=192066 RepID=UPI0026DB40B4|nr:2-hydroxymuconic semialdehyde dehydrogenase [Neisseria sp.]MDO4249026.1 2-hydroxymuconic semialdehyde dehydrogenase [Neisseria sp.]